MQRHIIVVPVVAVRYDVIIDGMQGPGFNNPRQAADLQRMLAQGVEINEAMDAILEDYGEKLKG